MENILNYKKSTDNRNQKGQVLLITVMLLAAAITVVMTIAFNSTTETQITKLEEESQKALSAAEAALEAAIQKRGTVILEQLDAFTNAEITGKAEVEFKRGNSYVTPLLQRDEQFTFYLAEYEALTNYWTGDLVLYVKSESDTSCPALEITYINADNSTNKEIIDPCNTVINGSAKITTTSGSHSLSVDGITYPFGYRASGPGLTWIANAKLMIVRVLNEATRIGFEGVDLMPQGRTITSTAKTTSGVTKQILLIQTYPQIPSDFFVTSF